MRTWLGAAVLAAILAAILLPATPVLAQTKDPAVVQIESFYQTLVAAMKGGATLGVKGRYDKLRPAIEATFNLKAMTSLSVGPEWRKLSDEKRAALTEAFSRMTVANYAKNFESFHGEEFVVEPKADTRGSDKIVKSKLIGSDGTVTPFNYRMRQSDGSWKIIDIFLNGFVSELATRRADYSSTIKSGGPDALVNKINDLSDKLMK